MEQVFFRLHVRSSAVITKVFPRPVRYTVEVSSFFTAVLLLLLLGTLHLTFVNNELSTRCFTDHIQQSYPAIGVAEGFSPMQRGWWEDTDAIRIRVQAWELCSSPPGRADGLDTLRRSSFCNVKQLPGNYSNLLRSFALSSEQVDELLPAMYDTFATLIGQHISAVTNLRDQRVKQVLTNKAERMISSHRVTLSCTVNCNAGNQAICSCPPSAAQGAYEGTIGDLLLYNRDSSSAGSTVFLNLWSHFLSDFVDDAVSMFGADSLYLFAIEKGYLMLSPALRAEHKVSVLDVVLPKTSPCFRTSYDMLPHLSDMDDSASSGFDLGALNFVKNTAMSVPQIKSFTQDERVVRLLRSAFEYLKVPSDYIIRNIIGYDVIVTNWMVNMFHGEGYLFNVYSKDVFDVSRADTSGGFAKAKNAYTGGSTVCTADGFCQEPSDEPAYSSFASPFVRSVVSFFEPTAAVVSLLPLFWQKLVVLASTMFLFFTTSTLVSFTLKETQERMLRFTYLLQYHIRQGIPVTKLVVTHLIESLVFVPIMVGIMGFLYEFFGDSLLTFLLLSMLWICECYTVVCVRTTASAVLFPRFSFVLFCFFHFYSFSFPFGFSYIALATVSTMLWYIMLHFWNQHELPALLNGQINALNVRMMYQGGILSMIPESMHHMASAAAESARDAGSSVPMLSEEDVGGSALSQILDTAHDRAATKAQLLSKNRPSSQPNPSVIKRNPRISKQDQKQMQSHHQPQDASFPPLPIPARLRSGSSENPSIKINPRGGASWRSSRENSGDNDYDVGLSLDEDQPRPLRKSPVAKLTVADQIQLSKRIQAQEMEAAVNNMLIRTSSRLSVGRDLAGQGGTPTAVDSYGYRKDEYSVFGGNQED